LRIATIFTYGSNEDSDEANDSLPDDELENTIGRQNQEPPINQVTAEIN
jgi:type I restriction enzyme R subunit